jgi:hypothetical protein
LFISTPNAGRKNPRDISHIYQPIGSHLYLPEETHGMLFGRLLVALAMPEISMKI